MEEDTAELGLRPAEAKTSGRFSRAARKRSAGGVGSGWGLAFPASSRAMASPGGRPSPLASRPSLVF